MFFVKRLFKTNNNYGKDNWNICCNPDDISNSLQCVFEKFEQYHLKETPPNCIKISENFYADITETTNQHYREFLSWTQLVFGESSPEAKANTPDTLIQMREPKYGEPYYPTYFRFPAYSNYPVVGVSQKQAKAYARWRSDRVFEMYLIKYGIIVWESNQTPENYFTIERFFNGEIKKIKDVPVRFYPHYRLPTAKESEVLVNYYDSINKSVFPDYPLNCMRYYKDTSSQSSELLISWIYKDCLSRRPKDKLFNIRGNVSEWNEEENFVSGGSWKDEKYRTQITDTTTELSVAWIGFRNVFEWKEWNK